MSSASGLPENWRRIILEDIEDLYPIARRVIGYGRSKKRFHGWKNSFIKAYVLFCNMENRFVGFMGPVPEDTQGLFDYSVGFGKALVARLLPENYLNLWRVFVAHGKLAECSPYLDPEIDRARKDVIASTSKSITRGITLWFFNASESSVEIREGSFFCEGFRKKGLGLAYKINNMIEKYSLDFPYIDFKKHLTEKGMIAQYGGEISSFLPYAPVLLRPADEIISCIQEIIKERKCPICGKVIRTMRYDAYTCGARSCHTRFNRLLRESIGARIHEADHEGLKKWLHQHLEKRNAFLRRKNRPVFEPYDWDLLVNVLYAARHHKIQIGYGIPP